MYVIVHHVYDHFIIISALLLDFVCAMMKIISENAQKKHTKVEEKERGYDN